MKSIKTKLITMVLSILGITLVLTILTGIFTAYVAIKDNVRGYMASMGDVVDLAMGSQINSLKALADGLSDACYDFTDGEEHDMLGRLWDAKATGYLSLSLVRADGMVFSTDDTFDGSNIADKDYFQKALAGETTVSTTEYDNTGRLVVSAASKLLWTEDWDGVLLLRMDGQVFSEIIRDIVIGETGNVFILDQNGTMIANKRPELVEERQNFIEKAKTDKTYATAAEVYARMIRGEKDVAEYSYETGTRICAFGPVQGSDGWSYGVVAPLREMTATSSINIALCTIGVIMLVIGTLVTITFSNRLVRPLRAITDRIALLASGDLSSPVETVETQDEVGILAASTADMVSALKEYIHDIEYVLSKISGGNLCVSTTADFKGEFLELKTSVDQIHQALNKAMLRISSAAEQVSMGAGQVSDGAQALAQGATEQASSVEQLAASIGSVSTHVKDTSNYVQDVSVQTEKTGEVLMICNQHMQDMSAAMAEINQSSIDIGKIIKTIEDIAFQTNILALNAAVEAARAGAAGKGFAVVADEVRNLASRSAEASKNTSALIGQSVATVEKGMKIASETAESLSSVVEGAGVITEAVSKIAEAAKEQSVALSDIREGIEQISSVVQTTSATSEESAAASEELSSQAELLRGIVARFQLNHDDAAQ